MNGTKTTEKQDILPKKSLKKNAALNMARTLASLVFPLITFPYTSRVLGPAHIGKVHFAQSVVSYFSLVAALGISSYAVRETARLRGDKMLLSAFVKEIFCINMVSTAVSYCLFFAAIFLVQPLAGYRKLLCIISGTILFTTLGMDWLYAGLEEFAYIAVRSIVFQFVSLVLLFALVRTQDDYLKYAGISVVSNVGSNILNFLHSRRFVDFRVKAELALCRHLKPVFTLFAMSAAVSIYMVLDTTMLGFLKGDEAVGLYTAATKINRMVVMMITAATAVLLPRLSCYAKSEDRSNFMRLADKSVQFILLFSVPCAVGLFVLAEPVILLFSGGKYTGAVSAMKIMNAVIVLISISGLIGTQILMALGKENATLISVVAGAAVNFILNSILIPKFSVNGAASATVCAEIVVTAIQIVYARKLFNWKKICIHLLQVSLASAVMGVAVYFVCTAFDSFALKTGVGILSGMFVYPAFLFLFRNKFLLDFMVQIKGRLKK